MRRYNFKLALDKSLGTLGEDAQIPQSPGGPDPSQTDPALKQQQKNAEQQGANKVGANKPAPATPGTPPQQNTPQAQQASPDQAKQQAQGTQLGLKMADFDKQIVQMQAKITGGAAKPSDMSKLNSLLTAKKSVQDQFMTNYGVKAGS